MCAGMELFTKDKVHVHISLYLALYTIIHYEDTAVYTVYTKISMMYNCIYRYREILT